MNKKEEEMRQQRAVMMKWNYLELVKIHDIIFVH
jgi:hypothetical protein